MKLHSLALANAAGVTVAVVYLVCALAFVFFPDGALLVAQTWIHGLDLSLIQSTSPRPPTDFIIGLLTAAAGSWLVGYLFAKAYNLFLRE